MPGVLGPGHNSFLNGPLQWSEEWDDPPGGSVETLMIRLDGAPKHEFHRIAAGDPHALTLKARSGLGETAPSQKRRQEGRRVHHGR